MDFKKMCMEVKSKYYQQYVKNPQLRILPVTSADFICKNHPHFTRVNIRTSTGPHVRILLLADNVYVTNCTAQCATNHLRRLRTLLFGLGLLTVNQLTV